MFQNQAILKERIHSTLIYLHDNKLGQVSLWLTRLFVKQWEFTWSAKSISFRVLKATFRFKVNTILSLVCKKQVRVKIYKTLTKYWAEGSKHIIIKMNIWLFCWNKLNTSRSGDLFDRVSSNLAILRINYIQYEYILYTTYIPLLFVQIQILFY